MNVLGCLLKDQSTKEFANTLFISPHTVHDSKRMLVYFFSNI
ncbi:hypothetical protein NF868_16485 [Bacillus zhangzhouensis]|nr:hypothetical protein NF868_16485 [Bacillus zhangzhouensis]